MVAVDVTAVTGDFLMVETHRLFAEKIEKESGGKLVIKRVDPSQVGGFKQAIEGLTMGTLQMSHSANANVAVHSKGLMIYDMPFLFLDWDHIMRFAKSEVGQAIEQELLDKAGLKLLFYYEDGPRALFNRIKPIGKPEDMKGMKIRVMENPVYIDTYKALGAHPTPMSVTEIYMGLKQGVIDGADSAPYAFLYWKLQETAKYCSYTNHLNPPAYMVCSAKWYNSLSKDLQNIVMRVSNEVADRHARLWAKDREDCDKKLREYGVQINEVNRKLFEKMAQPVWKKYADEIGGWSRIQTALDLK
jgi:tripartite ATP-independent transporter DctP family solute receptor